MASISTTRRVLAVMAVATALCADRVAVPAPSARPQGTEIAQLASRLVSRLAQNFRQAMPATLQEPDRRQDLANPAAAPSSVAAPLPVAHAPLSPFQFRLPPPVV